MSQLPPPPFVQDYPWMSPPPPPAKKRKAWPWIVGATAVLLAAGALSDGSDSTSPKPATTVDSPVPETTAALSVTDEIGAWYSVYGTSMTGIQSDLESVSDAALSGDIDATGEACHGLLDTVTSAQSDPPIPDPESDREWRAALSDFADGAGMCIYGADNYDADAISSATDSFNSGTDHISNATDRLTELAGN